MQLLPGRFYLCYSDNLSRTFNEIALGEDNIIIVTVYGDQAVSAVLFDISLPVDYKYSRFADIYAILYLYQYNIAVVIDRLHAISEDCHCEISVVSFGGIRYIYLVPLVPIFEVEAETGRSFVDAVFLFLMLEQALQEHYNGHIPSLLYILKLHLSTQNYPVK